MSFTHKNTTVHVLPGTTPPFAAPSASELEAGTDITEFIVKTEQALRHNAQREADARKLYSAWRREERERELAQMPERIRRARELR